MYRSIAKKNMKRVIVNFLAGAFLAAALISCDKDNDPKQASAEAQKEEVLAALAENSNLSEFAEALEKVDFSNVKADALTVFAVENDGMTKSSLKAADNDFNIKRHIVKGKHEKSSLTDGSTLAALDGSTLTIKIEGGKIYINGVELGKEIQAGNSVAYIVEKAIPASNSNGGYGKVQLLETVSSDDKLELKYEYDEQDRIKKMIFYEDDGKTVSGTNIFSYDAGDLVSIKYESVKYPEENWTDNFKKTGNKIIINNNDKEYLDLNTQGLPVKWAWEDSYETCTHTMEYDTNGNLRKWTTVSTYDGNTSTWSSTYTYDDKKSPFYHCKTPIWVFVWEDDISFLDQEGTNKNNILTVIDEEDGSKTTYTPYSYIYDKDGYPTTIKVKWDEEDDTTTFTLTYITK